MYSFADLHHPGLKKALGVPRDLSSREMKKVLNSKQGFVTKWFYNYMTTFDKMIHKDVLKAKWSFLKFEWQNRGVIHCHAFLKLKYNMFFFLNDYNFFFFIFY